MIDVLVVGSLSIISILYLAAHYNFWRPARPISMPRILMYHSIGDEPASSHSELVVTPDAFEKQLKLLKGKGYTFLKISELLNSQNNQSKKVAITFDDGFKDNYEVAFPLLKKYGAKATVYLAPEIDGIEKLSKEMISEMVDSDLIEFGAHTLSHCNLEKCDAKSAEAEVKGSKERVETLTGRKCEAFAYPFGRFNDDVVNIVKSSGFSSAVTVKKGISNIVDPFRIKRISVLRSTNILQFRIALSRGRYRV
jgi:peptidoglycan/xylan/chitin deacetylase (PgdA/CDA1 family)